MEAEDKLAALRLAASHLWRSHNTQKYSVPAAHHLQPIQEQTHFSVVELGWYLLLPCGAAAHLAPGTYPNRPVASACSKEDHRWFLNSAIGSALWVVPGVQ